MMTPKPIVSNLANEVETTQKRKTRPMHEGIRAHRRSIWLILLVCHMAMGISVSRGQGDTGGVIGFVTDPSQAVVVKARVTAKNLDTGYERATVTAADGSFAFNLLDAGRYRIEVIAKGFGTLIREPITVRVTEITDLHHVSLTVGPASESVTVNGDAALLQTTDATLGKVFDGRMVTGLPLVTRNFTQLLALQSGVVSDIPNAASFGQWNDRILCRRQSLLRQQCAHKRNQRYGQHGPGWSARRCGSPGSR
jgi:hypothetical protein